MGVADGGIAVRVGLGAAHAGAGIVDGGGRDGRGQKLEAEERAVGGKSRLDVGNRAEIGERGSVGRSRHGSRSCATRLAHGQVERTDRLKERKRLYGVGGRLTGE